MTDRLHGITQLERFIAEGDEVTALVRNESVILPDEVKRVVGDMTSLVADGKLMMADVDVVVHTAARVHIMDDSAVDPLSEFRKTNTEGTLSLAR